MTHEPPLPPDAQSPYPIPEAPHEHPAPLPPVAEHAPTSRLPLIAGAIAAVGLAAGGTIAFVLARTKPKRGRRKA